MHTIYYEDQKMHFDFVDVIYYIFIADMFRPQEYKYNYYMSKPVRS